MVKRTFDRKAPALALRPPRRAHPAEVGQLPWRDYPPLPAGTSLRAAVLGVLADRRWHGLCEIYQAVEGVVPAGLAIRTYLRRYRGDAKTPGKAKPLVYKELAGRKRAVYRCLQRLVSEGLVRPDEGRDWDRQYRLGGRSPGGGGSDP